MKRFMKLKKIVIPANYLLDLTLILFKAGMEYEEKFNKDIGFPKKDEINK